MKLWIARDSDGTLWLHENKPEVRDHPTLNLKWWYQDGEQYEITEIFMPQVTFETSPQQVEIKLIEDKESSNE